MKMRRIAATLITAALLMSMVPSWVIADNEPSANPQEPAEQTETVTDPQEGDPEVPDTDEADPEEAGDGENDSDGDGPATETVSYLYDNGTEWQTLTVEAVVLTAEHENELTSGWYVVTESFEHEGRYEVRGSVHLILADNVVFNPRIGITVEEENELSIYAQSTGDHMGRLIVDAFDDSTFDYNEGAAGIGGGHGHRVDMISAGTINIYGGYIYSSGGKQGGAGIGGAANSNGGTINIHGGHIVARGRGYGSAAAIGAGGSDNGVVPQGANITITGGIIDIISGKLGDNTSSSGHSTISTLKLDCSRSPDMILRIVGIQAKVTSLNGSTFAAFYDAESDEPDPSGGRYGGRNSVILPTYTNFDYFLWYSSDKHLDLVPAHTVTYNFHDGEPGTDPQVDYVRIGYPATPPSDPEWEGHHFLGWYEGSEQTEFDFATPICRDYSLDAHWTNTYTVTFADDLNEDRIQTVIEGECAERPVDPSHTGARFLGWYQVNPDGTISDTEFDFDTQITETIELKAGWEFAYLDTDGEINYTGATILTPDTTTLSAGWYVAVGNLVVNNRYEVQGDVRLILADNSVFTSSQGINVTEGNALTIYAQSDSTEAGRLTISGLGELTAGIGASNGADNTCGNITINGGCLDITGGSYGAAIGGIRSSDVEQIVINGGTLNLTGGSEAAAIGGGDINCNIDEIIINGGTITATGGSSSTSAIGYGLSYGNVDNIKITGGTVTVSGASAGFVSNSINIDGDDTRIVFTDNSMRPFEGTVTFVRYFSDGTNIYNPGSVYTETWRSYSIVNNGEIYAYFDPAFRAHSLVLDSLGRIDDILGVNFYVDFNSLTEQERQASYMEFTVNGIITSRADFNPDYKNMTGEYYGFSCYVSSVQMADTITATLHYTRDGVSKTVSQEYTVEQYLQYVEAHSGDYSDKVMNLIYALHDYGHYVQPFLSAARGWVIGTDHAAMSAYHTDYSGFIDSARAGLSNESDYGSSIEYNTQGIISSVSYSLMLESATSMRVYFRAADGYEDFYATYSGPDRIPCVLQPDGRYMFSTPATVASQMGTPGRVNIYTSSHVLVATIRISPMTYARTVLYGSPSDVSANCAMASLYHFGDAAYNYIFDN